MDEVDEMQVMEPVNFLKQRQGRAVGICAPNERKGCGCAPQVAATS